MRLKKIVSIVTLLAILSTSPQLMALPTTHFATSSKLATGHWVKIRVSETGVHEITSSQLSEMGFSDPSKVKIFGRGGNVLAEALTADQPDDIAQIPVLVHNGKIIFFANGATKINANTTSNAPYFIGEINPYSKYGYYFLTDSDNYQPMTVEQISGSEEMATNRIEDCYDYVYYNNELFSFINSGKTFYGEDLLSTNNFSFKMPNLVAGKPITLALSVGGNADSNSTINTSIDGQSVSLASSTLKALTSTGKFEVCTTTGTTTISNASDSYNLSISVTGTGVNSARLDYYSVTYRKSNEIPTDSVQTRLAFLSPTLNDLVVIKNVTNGVMVWDVTDAQAPKQNILTLNETEATFSQTNSTTWAKYVAFYPDKNLKSIVIEGQIDNQNLHAAETPDMVIIYPKNFKVQAEKLAKAHNTIDGLTVLTVDEDHIFNEFSSGAQDATAYRLFLKMLFDRNPDKLKFMLLLGCGSFDNRGIHGIKSENQLLTYQSLDSNGSVSSYVTDDYFGFLKDNSGKSLPTDLLSISIGRIPARTVTEAEQAIDKTIRYMSDIVPESWHNNVLILSDDGDNDLHTFQAEGIEIAIDEATGGNSMKIEKIFQEWYNTADISDNLDYGAENKAREKVEQLLKEGVLFGTYIGHAVTNALQGYRHLWTSTEVKNVNYPHLPFLSIASCETGLFDGDEMSISEDMILTPEGGAIGVLSAARTVYSTQNDRLNKALMGKLFQLKSNGEYNTIGEACMEAKKTFGQSYNFNKLSFILFGDPAVKVRFPLNHCKVTTINGTTLGSNISVSPSSAVTITGIVCNEDGNIDSSFNGEVTVSIYDKKVFFKEIRESEEENSVVYQSYYPREKLCNVTGTVTNGTFNVSLTLPTNCKATGETGLIRIFAKSDDNRLVAGSNENLIINEFNPTTSINDSQAPKIAEILIDGQNAEKTVYTSSNPTIYIEATDDNSINTKPNDVQGSMKLTLDNGKESMPSLSNMLTVLESGKVVKGSVTLYNLTTGRHSLHVSISDIAGNTTQKDIIFYVVNPSLECELSTSSDVTRDNVELTLTAESDLQSATFNICDAAGNLILSEDSSSNTFTWNMKDDNGARVKAGRYTIHASFYGNEGYGCSKPAKVVVLGN